MSFKWRIKSEILDDPPPARPILLHFHADFRKKIDQIIVWRPSLGNPRSAPVSYNPVFSKNKIKTQPN